MPYMSSDFGQTPIQKILFEKLRKFQAENPGQGLRAFAKQLGLSSGSMAELVQGKRRISKKMAERLLLLLRLDAQESFEFLRPFHEPLLPTQDYALREKESREFKALKLKMDEYRFICDWHHFAILSLFHTTDFQSNCHWIAKRLGISERTASDALGRLTKFGLVNTTGAKWTRTVQEVTTSDDVRSLALREAHGQTLELIKKGLHEVTIDKRDVSSVNFAIDPVHMPRAKQLIRKFQDDLAELMEAGNKTEVYSFLTALIPLTKQGVGNET